MQTLYLSNSSEPIHRSDLHPLSGDAIFQKKRGKPLVAIGAYCLMPNHFHLLLQEITENGISRFMQKVGTAYAMYFNIKNDRVGGLFVKPFRSKFIGDDRYVRRVAQYIHLNPAELYEPEWKSGQAHDIRTLQNKMLAYRYSSLPDYFGVERAESRILDPGVRTVIADGLPALGSLLSDASEYYKELGVSN